MPIMQTEASPLKPKQLRPQDQDSPTASYGRYGLYRALMATSTPRLRLDDPVQGAIDKQQSPRVPRR